ncbi:MAG: glycosyltransferase [Lachnospiraceae bacterium]|jgi:glycosyltransferase involved in cell wall biosynthesis|nr:glycosyltransferase [Lachnospiraceae bacterium]
MKEMSVAFHLNCLCQGGAERVVSSLANQFAEEGYTVYVATEWYDTDEFELDPRVQRVHVGLHPEDGKKNRVTKFFLRIRYLKQFLKEYRPSVLVAFAQRANYRALMAAGGGDIPVVISIRTDPVGHYDALSDRIQIRRLFPKAAGCVFQTQRQREFFRPYLQDNSKIILNPVNPRYIGVPKPAVPEKSVVHHARLVDFKNQPLLCRAFLKVHAKHPDYVLKIIGPDSHDGTKEILDRIIEENHAEDFILLTGGSSAPEQELVKGSVYAFSSDWEGLPNSLMEAMALGLPCVATDCPCGGPAEVIRDGVNGLLVPIRDEDALAAAINRLIEDRELAARLGAQAAHIADTANAQAVFEQWRDYLGSLVR